MRFIWKIENFNCLNDGLLSSPKFNFQEVSMEVRIHPRGCTANYNCIHVELQTFKLETVSWNCAVAFLDAESLPLTWQEKKDIKLTQAYYDSLSFCTNRDEVFGQRKAKFLPNGNLTVQCIFWRTASEFSTIESQYARTRFEPLVNVREKTFTLNIPNVSTLVPNWSTEREETFDGESLIIQLALNKVETFVASLSISHVWRIHSKCKIFILDANGKEIQFANEKFYFPEKGLEWKFGTNITKNLLMCYQNQFLPSDSLSLVFKFTFSWVIAFSRLVDESEIFTKSPNSIANSSRVSEPRSSSVLSDDVPSQQPDSPGTISQVLRDIYEEGFLSDFSLRVQDRTFPVHKNILGARSSVFRAMFTADMKEKASSHVDIPDVEADTIERMLKFVYCDSFQDDIPLESASKLYAAADKYDMQSLKQRCSDLLKLGLSASSVLGVLLLADSHQDQNLKSAALDFIRRNDKDLIGTENWRKFAVENVQLAFDAMQELYLKKMDV